tara:strand:- start:1068 stop:1631 length:564 start_codon:yes stop_codon:yes gene_type:complete
MSKRTLVGSFEYGAVPATGKLSKADHIIFAYESLDQTKSWRIEEIQVWLNPFVNSGGDNRAILSYCLSTDFLDEPTGTTLTDFQEYAKQFNAEDNRGIAWGFTDYQNRDGTTADFRVPGQGIIPFGMIADGRRAINYLILNTMVATEGSALSAGDTQINYRIVMTEINVSPMESILHQVRGLSQDVS